MRVCPICRAEVDDFCKCCEYCGYELGVTKEYSLLIQNAELLLAEIEKFLNDTKQKKEATQLIKSVEILIEELTTKYINSREIQNIVNLLNEKKNLIQSKNNIIGKKLNKRKRISTVIFSIISEILLIAILIADNLIDISLIETFVIGGVGFICGLFGLGIGGIVGVILGLVFGGLLGKLLFVLITTSIGKIISFLLWQFILIVINVISLKNVKSR